MIIKKEYVMPFVEATTETFSAMCSMECSKSGRVESLHGALAVDQIVCIIGFTGDVKGAIVLSMPMDVAVKLVSAFVYEELTPDNPELTDGFGELLNIIAGAGGAKIEGKEVKISLPTTLMGKDKIVVSRHDTPWAKIPMKFSDGGEFSIVFSIQD